MNILIIAQGQFGYNAGCYHYTKHLVGLGYKIIFLCNDYHLEKVEVPNVKVVYVDEPSAIKWRFKFSTLIKPILAEYKIDVVLYEYYKCCFLNAHLFRRIPVLIDIRTGDIAKNKIRRAFFNWLIKFESLFFSHTITLSESLAKKLKFKDGSYDIVTLGSDIFEDAPKQYEDMNLLYVGTLKQRDIHKTIQGLVKFMKGRPQAKCHYDIIGFGTSEEESHIKNLIKEHNLEGIVEFHGRINYEFLKPYFKRANVGVAFVPMTPYYDCQPSTKIYEYVLSGLYCIATNTYENKLAVDSRNGLLCDDNADSFAKALTEYYDSDRSKLNSDEIRDSMRKYLWTNVVSGQLVPAFERMCKSAK